ncbi:hypothetical protein PR202_gb22214 [Eleusine coracana subsp. coracana]|uniref:Uncharacterized protein n=1 Tax=Eleusine coracana subsp. coracana TaxID=191504 RepID=A0AAV5FGN7_ELECO|nr:hypothetical protein PR202_gb22214 [Eleusine coracana subsp. coracana]
MKGRSSCRPPARSFVSSADLLKYAGYALVVLGCGIVTYFSYLFPTDALHKKSAPLPEDLHAVSYWCGHHKLHSCVLLQLDSIETLKEVLARCRMLVR